MATDTISGDQAFPSEISWSNVSKSWAMGIVKPLASLRLTVALFAMAILLIFVGTLAQVELNMWEVIDKYFRSWIAWVDLKVFFPKGWFPESLANIPGRFPMPGGMTLGVLMMLNLEAAHLIRFKVQAQGTKRVIGAIAVAVGALVTMVVIYAGHSSDGLQGRPPFEYTTLWQGIRVALYGCAAAFGLALFLPGESSFGRKSLLIGMSAIFAGLGFWASSVMLTEPTLRILWQLIQGGFSALILLGACALLFGRRAGVVLLHLGITLMMLSELYAGLFHVENRITVNEGETINYARDIRAVELAIVDPSKPETDDVIVVPGSRLVPQIGFFGRRASERPLIQDSKLPFDIHVQQYMKNTELVDIESDGENYATHGNGRRVVAHEIRAGSGAESGEVDFAAAYVEFREKDSEKSLGRYLLSQLIAAQGFPEKVEVGDKTYDVTLRFKRNYKPYCVSLKDVRKDDYLGTNMPMNYSSDVLLTKANEQGIGSEEVGEFHIWMNNPLRYSGETFYQSGYNYDPRTDSEATTLQVVKNYGWMMPYIGCMFVSVGMAAHFWSGLWRFLERKLNEMQLVEEQGGWVEVAVPFVLTIVLGGYALSKFKPPMDTKANMKIHEFGKLPVVYQGRAKPMDTLARNSLRIVSNRETFVAGRPNAEDKRRPKKEPAIRWLLDVISGSPEAKTHRVYRIDNLDVLGKLGLQRRKGFRYAEEEFDDKLEFLGEQLKQMRGLDPEKMSLYQKKLVELERRIETVRKLEYAFTPVSGPDLPTPEELKTNSDDLREKMLKIRSFVGGISRLQETLNRMEPALVVPTGKESDWEALANATGNAYLAQFTGADVPEATRSWAQMLSAYQRTNVNEFNEAVFAYQAKLQENTPTIRNAKGEDVALDVRKVAFEHFFNSSQPFLSCSVLYVVAFVLVCFGWLATSFGKFTVFNRSAFLLIAFTFTLHSFALMARVYISGRPPITNLYSSAIFIGWAAVAFGLILERLYRMGIGNALASAVGFSTLLIAYSLAADGDTFTVLRAVLDTQFWLATHVVCITLGYATTFVAGALGVAYVLSMATRRPALGKALTSMTYGTLCFAIFFSFVGTVLGGLWADDSWGRFWGWDPKENGALMIVLWNALILHARWGGMVRQRGIALLAIFGNVVTAWSWFGVNELGVGLHSYGFTEGVLRNLGLFVLSQMIIIVIGLFTMFRENGQPKIA